VEYYFTAFNIEFLSAAVIPCILFAFSFKSTAFSEASFPS